LKRRVRIFRSKSSIFVQVVEICMTAIMLDHLIQDYIGIDYSIVWDVVKNKIPELYTEIVQVIDN
jgi:uncharacterized protein with HEPN domain